MPPSAPWTRAWLALVILVASMLSASTWRVYSHTWDEPEHLAAGLQLLDRGRYEYDTQHPPIARVLIALGPYLAGAHSYGTPPPDGVQEGIDILYGTGHYWLYLTLARMGTLPFLALLLFAQWLWARRVLASDTEALLAVVLLACVPPVLGHAGLATLDVAAAATDLLALYLLQRWLACGGVFNAILVGLSAGVAVGTKLSAVPFLGFGAIALIAVRQALMHRQAVAPPALPQAPRPAEVLASGALIGIALSVPILIAYGHRAFGVIPLPRQFQWALAYLLHDGHGPGSAGVPSLVQRLLLPRGLWDLVEGIARIKQHNDAGHFSFLLGQERSGGWWYFYLVALAVKTPLPLLVTTLPGWGLMLRAGLRGSDPWRIAPVVLFVTILAFASLYSHINIGVRHVLVLYPFMALGAAFGLARVWRWLDAHRDWVVAVPGKGVIAALVLWQIGTLWVVYPDYLPYFNVAVAHPDKVLIDSDLDWGQDLARLERRLAQLQVPRLSLAYMGTADLAREPLPPWVPLKPMQPVKGWIAITELAREHDPDGYAWLRGCRPLERIGKTIDLYDLR
jgi:4-amino-4-deoxy-L-arabinose transferase-like glycosyltransferase